MHQPPFLKAGDTVAILSTARKIEKSALTLVKESLETQGYKVIFGNSIGQEYHQFAGTDMQRAQDFQEALDDHNIKAIWCARGGYGTVRIIDHIDFSVLQNNPKWIIGYSDITVLHAALHRLGVNSIHGPMAFDINKCTAEVQHNFYDLLKGNLPFLTFQTTHHNKLGVAKGEAIGGNLSVIYSLCGSPEAMDAKGKILFLEDLDEYLYHIDRMVQNLKRNGYLEHLAGLVVGGMTHMHDNNIPFGYTAEEIILEATKDYDYPVVFNAPFGHIKENQPVVLGQTYCIDVTEEKVIIKADNQ